MNYYESVVIDYLRADRKIFLNTEYCIQLNAGENPDNSGPHWYCDAVAADFGNKCIFLCEISYSASLISLINRLKDWNENWQGVCGALARDSGLPPEWPVRPWLFVPDALVPVLLTGLAKKVSNGQALKFTPRITPLELVQPWKYRSWNRIGEVMKQDGIPPEMRV